MATTTTSKKTSNTKTTSKKSVSTSSAKKSTKTTKSVAKKQPTSSKKTVTKVVTKPVQSTKSKAKKTTKVLTAARIRTMRLIAAIVTALLAVPTVILATMTNVSLQVPHVANDPLLNVPAPAVTTYLSVPIPYLIAGLLVISAVFSLVRATRLQIAEERQLAAKVMKWRWLELGVVFAVLAVIVMLVAGLTNIIVLKLVALFILLGFFAGWLAESELPSQQRRVQLFTRLQALLLAVPVLVLAVTFIATAIYGAVTYNWSVYVAALVLTTGLVMTFSLQRRALLGADYLRIERAYLVTTFLSVVLASAVIVAGLGF